MRCYILAGGQSRRMGRSKLTMPFGDSTFLDRIVDVALASFDDVAAVQRFGDPPLPRVATIFEPQRQESAPIFGVLRALEDGAGKCFILAADYPLMTAQLLRFLRERAESSPALLIAPRWSGKLQMLCAAYDAQLRSDLMRRIAAGRLDLRGLVDDARSEIVEEEELRQKFDGEPLLNVNTPVELERARELDARR
jgi:molybdopterin-guanine dinucleotide biosynthesis protein A